MLRNLMTIQLLCCICAIAEAQIRNTHAVKVNQSIRIDGSLDEPAWQDAPVASDFITNSPVYGNPAAAKTEVRVLYDNSAIYIGAYLYDDPASIRRQLTARDAEQRADVDYFSVFLDTYHDKQNAFQFVVTARNVQTDARVSPNVETSFGVYGDLSWDAVWDSRISFKNDGWVVEIRIPFFAIRFPKKSLQDWGIQFLRFNRRQTESSFWNPVNPNVNGFVNQFGTVSGIMDIAPPLRLSFSPYVSGGYRETPQLLTKNKYETLRSGGMDVKYDITESFTLDATLIPDFGQVISDPIVNNITPYEIQFRDNRPFFTEGTELFNKAGIFYSRRIGKTPDKFQVIQEEVGAGSLNHYEIEKNPTVTSLYNAVKFSGRTAGNLGIGIFNAVSAEETARLRHLNTGKDSSIVTEPFANYNILVLDQALKNRSYITFTNTNVIREGNERDANVAALDIALYDRNNEYGLLLRPRYSMIFDTSGGYNGFSNYFEIGKVSGKLQYNLNNEIRTARYDPNDLGFLLAPNEFKNGTSVSYNIYEPAGGFLNQNYGLIVEQSYLLQPFLYQKTRVEAYAAWVFRNLWDLRLTADIAPFWYNDYFDLQTPYDLFSTPRQPLKKAPNYSIFADGSSDSRKKLYVTWNFGAAESPNPDDFFYGMDFTARYRFSNRFSITAGYKKQYDNGQFGYAFLRDGATQAPILARRQYLDVTTSLSGIYHFTPRMNITFRGRHFWNRIYNTNLYNVKADGHWAERFDMTPSDYNLNYNAFNIDVFYTWDFRLGSRLVLGWKNWLGSDYEYFINGSRYKHYSNNFSRVMATPHGNELTVRFIYFLNYEQLRRKR